MNRFFFILSNMCPMKYNIVLNVLLGLSIDQTYFTIGYNYIILQVSVLCNFF